MNDDMAANDETFVRVTNKEIWVEIRALGETVHSMDERMNAILTENVELRTRVRALELKVYAVLSAVGGAVLIGGGALAKAIIGG